MIGSRAPRRIAQVSRLAACRFPHSLVRSFLVVWFCALCPASVHATLLNFVDSYFDGADGVEGLGGAAAVAVSPDGNNVYVAGSGDSAVATFGRDPKNGQLVFFDAIVDGAAAEGLAGATAVAVSPDGAQVYVCGKSDSALTVFTRDAATGLLTFLESHFDGVDGNEGLGGATAIAVSPEATDVYVAGQSDASVAAFRRDPETGSLGFVAAAVNGVDGVAGLAGTSGVAVSPDGAHVYAVGRTENAVVTFSRDPGSGSLAFVDALVEGTNVPFGLRRPNAVAASPDGQHVYVASFDHDIAILTRDEMTGRLAFVQNIFIPQGGPTSLVLDPDGAYIYLTTYISSAVREMGVLSRDPTTGSVAFVETHANGIDGVTGLGGASSVAVSPDARDVYVTGAFESALALFTTLSPCPGDCGADRDVGIDELVTGINIALGEIASGQCPSLDTNLDLQVTIDEILAAVQNALGGCPATT